LPYLKQLDVLSHVRVFFEFVHKVLHVLLGGVLVVRFLALLVDVVFPVHLHIKTLQFPNALLLSATHSWVRFLHAHNVRQLVFVLVIVVFELLGGLLIQVVAQNRVVEVEELAKMCVHEERAVIRAELSAPLQLHAHHLEVLARCRLACTDFKVNVLNVDHDELREAFTGANRCEHVFPVLGPGDLVSSHRIHIHNVHACCDLV